MTRQENQIDIEEITFGQSVILEHLIIELGKLLYESLTKAERYDEVAALSEFIGEFTLLASAYGEQTNRIPEDLGVSLNEAVLFKLYDIKRGVEPKEWERYAEDTKKALDELKIGS